jgi:hypothetical protein
VRILVTAALLLNNNCRPRCLAMQCFGNKRIPNPRAPQLLLFATELRVCTTCGVCRCMASLLPAHPPTVAMTGHC